MRPRNARQKRLSIPKSHSDSISKRKHFPAPYSFHGNNNARETREDDLFRTYCTSILRVSRSVSLSLSLSGIFPSLSRRRSFRSSLPPFIHLSYPHAERGRALLAHFTLLSRVIFRPHSPLHPPELVELLMDLFLSSGLPRAVRAREIDTSPL